MADRTKTLVVLLLIASCLWQGGFIMYVSLYKILPSLIHTELIVHCNNIILHTVSRSVVFTPSNLLACPGDKLVVICSESDIIIQKSLRWIITPENREITVLEIALSDIMNATQRSEDGLHFYSELTSYSPLTAILTTTAHPLLNGATVMCETLASMGTLTIRVLETGS